jgi:hypothetical protein
MLKATAAKGSRFSGWSGACKGTGKCKVTTDEDIRVAAKFVLRPCVVPEVVGESLKAAKAALKKAFCSTGEVRLAASSKVQKGYVISQRPKPQARLRQHAKVNLVVSKG